MHVLIKEIIKKNRKIIPVAKTSIRRTTNQ
jgi:hypothetical protein